MASEICWKEGQGMNEIAFGGTIKEFLRVRQEGPK